MKALVTTPSRSCRLFWSTLVVLGILAIATEARGDLEFKASPWEPETTAEEVNAGSFTIRVEVTNTGEEEIVAWPCLEADLVGPDGKSVARFMRTGRHGVRFDSRPLIEEFSFITLQPGESTEWKVALNRYGLDPDWILGWRLSRSGIYEMKFTYDFDRAAIKERFGVGCDGLEDPDRMWNRAPEMRRRFSTRFEIRQAVAITARGCRA